MTEQVPEQVPEQIPAPPPSEGNADITHGERDFPQIEQEDDE